MAPKPDADAVAALQRASISDATPATLAMARTQAARRRPADLLQQLARDGFVQPCPLSQRECHRLDGLALDACHGFEALQLSPVAPLGSCSVLAPSHQDRTLSALRGTEVVSDPTNMLALIAAQRLRAGRDVPVKLCTIHQTLRAQALPPEPGFSRHFRLLALLQAGLRQPHDAFEVDAIAHHVQVHERLFEALSRAGHPLPPRGLKVLTTPGTKVLGERVLSRLNDALPGVQVQTGELELGYYAGIRVLLGPRHGDSFVPVADTGRFDWMAQLLSDRRYRLICSGFGLQLIPLRYPRPGDARGAPETGHPQT